MAGTLDDVFGALADPTPRAILARLALGEGLDALGAYVKTLQANEG